MKKCKWKRGARRRRGRGKQSIRNRRWKRSRIRQRRRSRRIRQSRSSGRKEVLQMELRWKKTVRENDRWETEDGRGAFGRGRDIVKECQEEQLQRYRSERRKMLNRRVKGERRGLE